MEPTRNCTNYVMLELNGGLILLVWVLIINLWVVSIQEPGYCEYIPRQKYLVYFGSEEIPNLRLLYRANKLLNHVPGIWYDTQSLFGVQKDTLQVVGLGITTRTPLCSLPCLPEPTGLTLY